jgi:excinuclease UvrABC nuclease subunit
MKDGKPLYIGSSANGLYRPADPLHHRRDVFEMSDEIVVKWCVKAWQAINLEAKLIRKYRPPFNRERKEKTGAFAPFERGDYSVYPRASITRNNTRGQFTLSLPYEGKASTRPPNQS